MHPDVKENMKGDKEGTETWPSLFIPKGFWQGLVKGEQPTDGCALCFPLYWPQPAGWGYSRGGG